MANPLQDCAVLFGDSLTQLQDESGNLHHRMSQAYERRLDVLNRGYSGYNSNGGRAVFDSVFARKGSESSAATVRLVTIWHGTNDCVLPPKPQSTSVADFTDNINFFLEALTSPTSPYAVADTPVSVVLLTPGPCVPSMFPPQPYVFRTLERHRQYRDTVLGIADRWKGKEKSGTNRSGWQVEVVDVWRALETAAGGLGEELRPFFTDGVHLTSRGYDVIWNELSSVIRSRFIGRGLNWMDPSDLPMRAPSWDVIDWQHPEDIPGMFNPPMCDAVTPTAASFHIPSLSSSSKPISDRRLRAVVEGPPTPEED